MVEFLQEKAKSDRELRQQELEFRREEQAKSQNMMISVLQGQQQMDEAFLSVVNKLI